MGSLHQPLRLQDGPLSFAERPIMVVKFRFIGSEIIDADVDDITVPVNPHGGSRNVEISKVLMFWTGSAHVYGSIGFQISALESIETRSSLDEDDEPWVLDWDRDGPWSYAGDDEAAAILEDIICGVGE